MKIRRGIKNYQIVTIFYVHHNMHSHFTTSKDLKHGSNNNSSMVWALLALQKDVNARNGANTT
jgi:hypothetical protein